MKFPCLVFTLFIVATTAFCQIDYLVLKDKTGSKLLKGIITKDLLAKDTAFA